MTTKADFDQAKSDYGADRYVECMSSLEHILRIPTGADLEQILASVRNDWMHTTIPVETLSNVQTADVSGGFLVEIAEDPTLELRSLGIYALIDVLELQSKCLSAIFYSNNSNLKNLYHSKVVENGFLVLNLMDPELPRAPNVMRLAGQSVLLLPNYSELGLKMIVEGIEALKKPRSNSDLFDSSDLNFAPDRLISTEIIPKLIEAGILKQDNAALVKKFRKLIAV